ncbi:MAG: FAD-dependent monooxygenase [Muribaculaceae bacterium]|nr:FAD-dependent monooxygenase [Muribaculaceae bacterium]
MIQRISLRLEPRKAADEQLRRLEAARQTGVDVQRIVRCDLIKRSIDARQRRVMVNLTLDLHIDSIDSRDTLVEPAPVYPDVSGAPQAIVVGAGPAGLFAALELIELGIRPIVVERGKDVDSRRRDMAAISRTQKVDPESNYCFGEGGAGAFSDGKLYTRSTKRGPVGKVLQLLHHHGAERDILVDAHPHIGTDRLPQVIKSIRLTIERHGGKVLFGHRVDDLDISSGGTVEGVILADGTKLSGPVILATGHSARDVYAMLRRRGVEMSAKGIAVGVRLEHPQTLIDSIQYHSPNGRGRYLPPAEYSMLCRVDGRAVYSFCMCPGGFIIPAASGPGQLVVNGMSPSNRGTQWANSGMVVEVLPEDIPGEDPLRMLEFQSGIEKRFHEATGGTQQAPAQRMTDFVDGRLSESLPRSSYAPGVISRRVDQLLPPEVSRRLQEGFRQFGHKARGFLCKDALVVGDETRTSAPVQLPRDRETLCHTGIGRLYPCGEGAGHAGGIVSAAIDGIRCARALAAAETGRQISVD